MAVPESVRKVPRPINTIVQDNGKDGPNRYPVRERISVTYISGGNPQPRNGKVIGHIVDGVYVPLGVPSTKAEPDMLSYGACAFVRSVSRDLFAELLGVYTPKDAMACTLTDYASEKLQSLSGSLVDGYCRWWLRELVKVPQHSRNGVYIESTRNEAGFVNGNHGLKLFYQWIGCPIYRDDMCTVRPALWVNMD